MRPTRRTRRRPTPKNPAFPDSVVTPPVARLRSPASAPVWLLFALIVAASSSCRWQSPEATIEHAEELIEHRKPAEALRTLAGLLKEESPPARALFVAGVAHERLGQTEQAVALYRRVPFTDRDSALAATSRMNAGRLLQHALGKWSQAVVCYREVVRLNPGDVAARTELAELLSIAGCRWESVPHFLAIVKTGEFERSRLVSLANTVATVSAPENLEHARKRSPRDPLVLLGLGTEQWAQHRLEEAREWFEQAIAEDPSLWEAHGRLGICLCELQAWQAMSQWQQNLPEGDFAVPNVWMAAGMWAETAGDPTGAARCYLEVLKLDPTDARAHTRLSQILANQGEPEAARLLAERARRLIQVQQYVQRVEESPLELTRVGPLIEALHELGRDWEAWGWARLMAEAQARLGVPFEETKALAKQLGKSLEEPTPWVRPEPLAQVLALAERFAVPTWSALTVRPEQPTPSAAASGQGIRFAIVNSEARIDFSYYNGTDSPPAAPRLVEVDGGGVGVLDYDGDGWPDLWWTQGASWPPKPNSRWLDRLYRNRGDGTFRDVTTEARILEWDFSQGIAVGDFDNDGFDDVVVANIGRNRWFRNQGDGTFQEVTDQVGVDGEPWSSSLLLADLNADGLPDYYEVNYLAGREARTRLCPDRQGTRRICPPMMFDPETDRLWINRGDGTFSDVTAASGVDSHRGRGLGITTWRDPRRPARLHLFVANDVTENFLWQNETPQPGEVPRFSEIGVLRGVAMDYDGRAQACMGIAVEDFDGDGRIDFFVTNFYDEWNTLYRQVAPGLFQDVTRGSGLGEASLRMLGFGTQPIDVNRDGRPDLVIANGHLVDETRMRIPYRMSPQCFLNVGEGAFQELSASQLGDYFEGRWLGRAMARLDYNRDGLEDFAVTQLYSPACLVANRSTVGGGWIALSLRARNSARQAVGTRVTVVTTSGERTQELTAGSGYQASNERRLVFGWAERAVLQEIVVEWPSGKRSVVPARGLRGDYIVVEGEERAFEIPD